VSFMGLSAAGAYLRRTRNFDERLAAPEEYLGATVSLHALFGLMRLGVYQRLHHPKVLGVVSLGIGF
jgi:hypothetical protein